MFFFTWFPKNVFHERFFTEGKEKMSCKKREVGKKSEDTEFKNKFWQELRFSLGKKILLFFCFFSQDKFFFFVKPSGTMCRIIIFVSWKTGWNSFKIKIKWRCGFSHGKKIFTLKMFWFFFIQFHKNFFFPGKKKIKIRGNFCKIQWNKSFGRRGKIFHPWNFAAGSFFIF